MPGCDFTRRDLLRWSAVALASPLVARRAFGFEAADAVANLRSGRDDVSPVNLELVTLTEDRAIITWYTGCTGTDDGLGRMQPAPADGVVHWGTRPDRLDRVAGHRRDTPYHYVELTGLEPGRTYYYQARSDGKPVPPTPFTLIERQRRRHVRRTGSTPAVPYSFTTPKPPPGRFLFSIALCNDLHMGETTAGLAGGIPSIKGIQQVPGLPPYPEVMLESLVEDASALGARYLLAAGDITAEAVPVDLSQGRAAAQPVRQVRHATTSSPAATTTAPHEGDAYAACRVGRVAGQRLLPRPVLPGRRADLLPPRAREGCGCSASTPTTSRATGQRRRRARRPSSSPGSAPSWLGTATSRRSCSATTRSSSRSRRSRSPRATRSTQARPPRSCRTTRACPGCSCTTPGTPTATSARSARSRRTSRCRRSPRARSTRAGSRCCASTPAASP